MPTAENAKLEYEASQNVVGMTELTDQGDNKDFKSAAELWSQKSGYTPDVKPNGLATGGVITPDTVADQIDITALTCYLVGVSTAVGATSGQALTRPSVDTHQKFSITVDSGGSIAVVDGAEGTSFSLVRGANGGPPYIPTTSIEIGQVWLDSQTPAVIAADEIKQIPGDSLERYDYPTWDVEHSDVVNNIIGFAGINFHSALGLIHTGDLPKKVYAAYATPQFAEVIDAYDYIPPMNSHTVSSTQVYGRTKGSKASAINQGSFSFEMQDGITDSILLYTDDILWFKFFQDRLETPYILAQGSLGVQQTFSAGENIVAACTISAEVAADRVTS